MSTQTQDPVDFAALQAAFTAMEGRMSALESRVDREVAEIREELPDNRITLIVFSNDLDKLLASYVIATGAAAMGMDVTMFFTFWGITSLKARQSMADKDIMQKMMSLMTPVGTQATHPSKMAFWGAGAAMMRQMMRNKDITSLEDMMGQAQEFGVRTVVCEMSMNLMGITAAELMPGLDFGGVATFLGEATRSKATLFI